MLASNLQLSEEILSSYTEGSPIEIHMYALLLIQQVEMGWCPNVSADKTAEA